MAGVPVKARMDVLGAASRQNCASRRISGLRIAGNGILMDINQLPTTPRLYGHLVRIKLDGDNLIETFASDSDKGWQKLMPPVPSPAFVYFRGGIVRFGKLTMADTDLEIVSDPRGWLRFDIDHYNDQLSTGCTKTTPSFGLVTSVQN